MYAPERQQEILRLARDGGRVDVVSLAEEFRVTAEAIRRDLAALDRAGLVRRVHGGAIPAGRLDFEPDLAEREAMAAAEKDRIAKAAIAEMPADGAVVLDAGVTVARLAGAIPPVPTLTVVTHSLSIAARLGDHPAIQLHLAGGRGSGPACRPGQGHRRIRRPAARQHPQGEFVRGVCRFGDGVRGALSQNGDLTRAHGLPFLGKTGAKGPCGGAGADRLRSDDGYECCRFVTGGGH